MIYAPIYIPTLCRYEHFKQCLESLAQCEGASETEVYVALDFPAKEAHKEGYEKIKAYLEAAGNMTFKRLHVHKRDHNYGLGLHGNSATMREYITERYDRFIISEDDNVFAPNFLVYMNTCFERYKDDPDVIAVCGYSYPVDWDVSEGATVLRQQINVSTWGVGFWTDKYNKLRNELTLGILKASFDDVLKNKAYKKMIDACLNEYVRNACDVPFKKNMLWNCVSDIAMREYLAVANKYALTPVISKVRNLGFDGTGAYCQKIDLQQNGDTAGTYNYTQQTIDDSHSFSLVENTKDSAEENRKRLNAFDYRSSKEMMFPRLLLWESENLGVWTAKLTMLVKKAVTKLRKRNYIIVGAMGGYISGAPIYYRNKALYMRSLGWNVYCVSCRGGQVYVDGLEQFIVGTFTELTQKPYLLSGKRQQEIVRKIISCIPNREYETVIETGTFYTAYWGEMLAKELNARHTIIYLDEHNVGIHQQQADFYKFKYEREELACISDEAYRDIFSHFWEYEKAKSYTLPCYCTNSLEDIVSPVIDEVKKADYTIGYVGRLEKDAFRALLNGLCDFAKKYPGNSVALNCFGGYDSKSGEDSLRERLVNYQNIQLFISGFLFPIPKKAIEKCDLCFASAGSVTVPVKANVATISMNVYTNLPDGFRIDPKNRFRHVCCPNCSSVVDYLKAFFVDGFRPRMEEYDLNEENLLFEKYLGEHLVFLERTFKHPLAYYDMHKLGMTKKERVKKFLLYLR